ncbi:hypothetical protein BH23ACT5_BH23ACT5_20090 [soil metagenome]
MDAVLDQSLSEIDLIVSAAAIPMLVVDYSPILERYAGRTVDQIKMALSDHDELIECLSLPVQLGASPEWARLYGFPFVDEAPDLIDRHFTPEAYPELRSAMATQFLAPFSGVTSIRSEHLAPTLSGDVIVLSHWKVSIRDGRPDYTRVVIVDVDVTEFRETQNSLVDAIESKDRLIATISHELRNPLTAVVGFSSILTSEWAHLDDATRLETASQISQQVGDVAAILDDFLTANVGNVLVVDDVPLTLGSALEGVDISGITVEIEKGVAVLGDPLRIRQIVRNLLRNAERHGGPNHILTATSDGDTVTLRMADDGPGVPMDVLDHLFEPYSCGSKPGSLGLGLAVSRTLAQALSGDLRYSRSGDWTVFELELRAA